MLGWALAANDAANVFGTTVASQMVRFRTAVILASVFIALGAVLEGANGIETIRGLTEQDATTAMISSLVAKMTVILMTWVKLPVSTSQAMVGALLGMGLCQAPDKVQWQRLVTIVVCWIGTPFGAAVIAAVLYPDPGRPAGPDAG